MCCMYQSTTGQFETHEFTAGEEETELLAVDFTTGTSETNPERLRSCRHSFPHFYVAVCARRNVHACGQVSGAYHVLCSGHNV